MGETKIIYHIDDEDTPYLIKLPIPADRVTLGDFKNALNRPNFKFFFKSMDDDFGFQKFVLRKMCSKVLAMDKIYNLADYNELIMSFASDEGDPFTNGYAVYVIHVEAYNLPNATRSLLLVLSRKGYHAVYTSLHSKVKNLYNTMCGLRKNVNRNWQRIKSYLECMFLIPKHSKKNNSLTTLADNTTIKENVPALTVLKTDCVKCPVLRKSFRDTAALLKAKLSESRNKLKHSLNYDTKHLNQSLKRKDTIISKLKTQRRLLRKENLVLQKKVFSNDIKNIEMVQQMESSLKEITATYLKLIQDKDREIKVLQHQIDDLQCLLDSFKFKEFKCDLVLKSKTKKQYNTPMRKCIYTCLLNHVPVQRTGHVIETIVKELTQTTLDEILGPTTIAQMAYEVSVISDLQVAEQLYEASEAVATLSWDSTTIDGCHVNEFHISINGESMTLNINKLSSGRTEDYVEHIKNTIQNLAETYSSFSNIHQHLIMYKFREAFKTTLSDRARVNHCINNCLSEILGKELVELKCNLHPLDGLASEARKVLRKIDEERSIISNIHGTEGCAANLVYRISKLRVVKEEIVDEDAHLPCFNGRVVSWLVAADNSASDSQSVADSQTGDVVQLPAERVGGIGDSRPPSFHANASVVSRDEPCDTCTESESVLSGTRRVGPPPHVGMPGVAYRFRQSVGNNGPRINGHSHLKHDRHRDPRGLYETSTMLSSDLESTSFIDSEEDTASRFSTVTDTTSKSSIYGRHRRRRRRHRPPPISRASSFSSITDSTMSLNIITVTLNMDTVNFLGISIVGQSNKGGDGGIYVGSIMKGGAVAQDGRVEPGDMILEVNGISFENMSNDDAVKTLREAVQKPGPIVLVVAKCWDPNPKGYFTVPRQEPVRPIDPSAWVAHTTAMREQYMGRAGPVAPSISNMTSTTSSSLTSSIPESERGFDDMNLTIATDMATVVKAMAQPDSGLEIRDRMWLKITIANAFIGADLVDWLFTHVEGFADRRDARKYACHLLKAGYIRHTVNKLTFSEQCYYVFGDYYGGPPIYPDLASLNLEDVDSVSEADRDTLAPLPPPSWTSNQFPYSSSSYLPQNLHYIPAYALNTGDNASFVGSFVDVPPGVPSPIGAGVPSNNVVSLGGGGSAGSVHSASVVGKDCACLSSTYNQLKRLWENKDKQIAQLQQHTTKVSTGASSENMGVKHNYSYGSPNNLHHHPACLRNSNSSLGSSASGSSKKERDKSGGKSGSGSDTDASLASARRVAPSTQGAPGAPPMSNLSSVPPEVSGSRQSFRMAMGNPSLIEAEDID